MSHHPLNDSIMKRFLILLLNGITLAESLNCQSRCVIKEGQPVKVCSPSPLHFHKALDLDDPLDFVSLHLLKPLASKTSFYKCLYLDCSLIIPSFDIFVSNLMDKVCFVLNMKLGLLFREMDTRSFSSRLTNLIS